MDRNNFVGNLIGLEKIIREGRSKVKKGEIGMFKEWEKMLRKCYDPRHPEYLNHDCKGFPQLGEKQNK